ncbi:33528_t:CDS:2, partial [Racocetra persica]
TKAELIARLEDFWNGPERDSGTKKLDKGKAVDPNSNDGYSERPLLPEDSDGQNYTFLSYMENRLEQKIDENITESSFPAKKFKKSRDQHEYDVIRDAGTLLQKAIQENSKEKAAEGCGRRRLDVVAKIPKPMPSKGDEFKELLVEARKQAKPYEGRPTSYSRRSWK